MHNNGQPPVKQRGQWLDASREQAWAALDRLPAHLAFTTVAAALVQRHGAQFTKAIPAKARLDDHGRHVT